LILVISQSSFQLRYRDLYATDPAIFCAPGRVNLIGEHTDYNDGFVMPAALEFSTWVGIAPRNDNALKVHSTSFNETVELGVDQLTGPPSHHWTDYIRGVAAVLQRAGHELRGANLLIESDVPLGSGLSSSAALEVSTALALTCISNIKVDDLELVKLCQRAEHEYAGTRCGIMDQFIARFGRADHALLLDCRSLQYDLLPIPADARIVVCNSNVRHALASGEYNLRRQDCEQGLMSLRSVVPAIAALRDVSCADLDKHKAFLSSQVYRRCRHVITEIERTRLAAKALREGELGRFGELMYESHRSLRDDFEVSCPELDVLVELTKECRGVYGSRMTGGGFGGCTVSLIAKENVEDFQRRLTEGYEKRIGKSATIYVCSAAEGARQIA
jgi:galactokinase